MPAPDEGRVSGVFLQLEVLQFSGAGDGVSSLISLILLLAGFPHFYPHFCPQRAGFHRKCTVPKGSFIYSYHSFFFKRVLFYIWKVHSSFCQFYLSHGSVAGLPPPRFYSAMDKHSFPRFCLLQGFLILLTIFHSVHHLFSFSIMSRASINSNSICLHS